MATKKVKEPQQTKYRWNAVYPVGAPMQLNCGLFTVTDGTPKAVLLDGRILGYAPTLPEAQAMAEAEMARQEAANA